MRDSTRTMLGETSLEVLASHALALSRAALPHLKGKSAIRFHGSPGQQAAAIAGSIERREIFQSCVSWDLHELIDCLNEKIEERVVRAETWSDDECDVLGTSWIRTYWSPEARKLATVRDALVALRDTIDAVIDRRDLDRILAKGRRLPTQPVGTAES